MHIDIHVKCPLFLSGFNELKFSGQISKNPQIQNFMKIHPVRAELFHADGQTDMTKQIVALRNFVNAPKTVSIKNSTLLLLLLLLLLHILVE